MTARIIGPHPADLVKHHQNTAPCCGVRTEPDERYPSMETLLEAVHDDLHGVWDSPTKNIVRKAFLRTNVSFAPDTWQRVERSFDNYIVKWEQMRAEVCEARWFNGFLSDDVFALRMSCLRKRFADFRALAVVFAQTDAIVVSKAVQASSSLSAIALCADVDALRAPHPPPRTAKAKAKVAAIREKLTDVKALNNTGKYSQGLALVRKLQQDGIAVAYRPVQAEVLYWLGELLVVNGKYQEGEITLYDAARVAGETRDSQLTFETLSLLAFVVGYYQARHQLGLVVALVAKVVLGLGGGHGAELLTNIGVVFSKQGEYDKALEYYRRSLAIREKTMGPEHPFVVGIRLPASRRRY